MARNKLGNNFIVKLSMLKDIMMAWKNAKNGRFLNAHSYGFILFKNSDCAFSSSTPCERARAPIFPLGCSCLFVRYHGKRSPFPLPLHGGQRHGGAKCKMGRFIKSEIRPETEICPTYRKPRITMASLSPSRSRSRLLPSSFSRPGSFRLPPPRKRVTKC